MNENTVGRRTALAEQSARKQSEKMFETARMEDLAVLDKRLINSSIAERLNLTLKTVQNYRNNIYRKLRVHNTEGLLNVLSQLESNERSKLLAVS